VRREAAGESGAGRDEVNDSRDDWGELQGDLSLSSDDLAVVVAGAVVVVVLMVVVGAVGVEHSSAAGGFWELASGVEGEVGVPTGPPFGVDSSLELTPTMMSLCGGERCTIGVSTTPPFGNLAFSVVVAWSFTADLGAAATKVTPLPLSVPLLVTPAQLVPLPAVAAAVSISAVAGVACVDAADSWPVLLPTFILESVDLRFDTGVTRAYSCADGTGGGRKGEPGDGKGDEAESLLTVTVSEGGVSAEGG
jgi:hypothetical protein